MDYEKEYKDALERARGFHSVDENNTLKLYAKGTMEYLFPVLKESEDEKIRNGIISNLDNMIAYIEDAEGSPKEKKFIINEIKKQKTWLENQGKSKFEQCIQKGDKIVTNEDGTHFNVSQLERVATKESKFKAGDWVITDKGDTVQIGAVNNGYYTLYNGMDFNMSYVDKCWHRWTIEDAKDGDVLHSIGWHNDCIFIFNGLDNWRFDEPNGDRAVATGYCCLFVSADKIEFGIQGPDCIEVDSVKPATREQRDLLFQRMKEAGYEWDAEKKELKKIHNALEECEIENIEHGKYYYCIKDYFCGGRKQASKGDVVQALRGMSMMALGVKANEYFLPVNSIKQKTDWSKEDDSKIESICRLLKTRFDKDTCDEVGFTRDKMCDYLSSLKNKIQPQWKPSDEQMHYLSWIANIKLGESVVEQEVSKRLNGLYEDLKKLKG